MPTLNAGCGDSLWGDIRIDIDPDSKGQTHRMDICEIDFPDDTFEVTRCISVLEHIPNWQKAVSELCRVTRSELIIEVPVNSNILLTDLFRLFIPTPKNIKLFFNRKERNEETFHQFDPKDIANELIMHDFYVKYQRIFQIYHSYPSRCWRFTCCKV